MSTTSLNALRRFAGFVFILSLFTLFVRVGAEGQNTHSLVTSSVVSPLPAPPTFGAVWQSAMSSHGDFVFVDFENGVVNVYPAAGGAWQSLTPPLANFGCCWADGGLALDSADNMYLNSNWAWDETAVKVPYSTAMGGWNMAASTYVGDVPGAPDYQNEGMGASPWSTSGLLILGGEDCCSGLYSAIVNPAGGAASNGATILKAVGGQIHSIAVDAAGNVYLFEPGDSAGILRIPAGTVGIASGQAGLTSGVIVDVEPMIPNPKGGSPANVPLLSNIDGVAVDVSGNVYISDGTAGIFMVPNENGTPNPLDWIMLSPIPATSQLAINQAGDTMFVPTTSLWPAPQTSYSVDDIGKVTLGRGDAGSAAVGQQAANPLTVYYSFTGNPNLTTGLVTPARFVIQEDGVTAPDFTVTSGGTCAVGTAYPIPSSKTVSNDTPYCTLNVNFAPLHVGNISAQLLLQTSQTTGTTTTYTTVATTTLHGLGLAPAVQTAPAWETSFGSGLKTPSQVATDIAGNIYVADSGLNQVLKYAAGSGATAAPVSIGSGLTQATGVAVDGNGDVFIADSGTGSVYEVPYVSGALSNAGQVTLVSGLGTGLTLAADGLGHLYIADPTNGRVVELSNLGGGFYPQGQTEVFLTSGFKAPSYVAVDQSNDLYIIDGSNLFELANGALTPLLTTLSNATAVAVDPSGAVYVSSTGGTVRIPYLGAALDTAGQASVASAVTSPLGLAIDNLGNVYLADGTALNVHVVTPGGSLNFGNVPLGTIPSLNATVTNAGNSALTTTAYSSTNSLDFTAADGTCEADSPVAAGATCLVDVTMSPGPGEQGTLTGEIGLASNAVNSSLAVIQTTGISAPLANSVSKISVGGSAEVIATPVTVTVAAASGTLTPSGTVTLTYPTWTVATPSPCGGAGQSACAPSIVPTTATATGTLKNGSYTFSLSAVLAGSGTFTVTYNGDRVFGRSTQTTAATVAKSQIIGLGLPTIPDPSDIYLPYTLETNGSTPYDGSALPFEYGMVVKVNTAAGIPTGQIVFNDNSSTCPTGTSATGIGVATCALTNYSGVACPTQSGTATQSITNSGAAPTGAQATFSTNCLQMLQNQPYTPVISTHFITPSYAGDANFMPYPGTTGQLFQVLRSPMVQISTSDASSLTAAPALNVTAGSSASMNLLINSILGYGEAGKNGTENSYSLPISLTCTNLPAHTTCTFTYPNPDPNISTAVDITCPAGNNDTAVDSSLAAGQSTCSTALATVTFNTNVAVGTSTSSQIARTSSLAFAGIFGLGMIGLFFRRRAFEKSRFLLIICMMFVGGALAASITACTTTNLSPNAVLNTPSGNTAVTITAQQIGSECLSTTSAAAANCIVPGSGSASDNGQKVYGSSDQISAPFFVNLTVQ